MNEFGVDSNSARRPGSRQEGLWDFDAAEGRFRRCRHPVAVSSSSSSPSASGDDEGERGEKKRNKKEKKSKKSKKKSKERRKLDPAGAWAGSSGASSAEESDGQGSASRDREPQRRATDAAAARRVRCTRLPRAGALGSGEAEGV